MGAGDGLGPVYVLGAIKEGDEAAPAIGVADLGCQMPRTELGVEAKRFSSAKEEPRAKARAFKHIKRANLRGRVGQRGHGDFRDGRREAKILEVLAQVRDQRLHRPKRMAGKGRLDAVAKAKGIFEIKAIAGAIVELADGSIETLMNIGCSLPKFGSQIEFIQVTLQTPSADCEQRLVPRLAHDVEDGI